MDLHLLYRGSGCGGGPAVVSVVAGSTGRAGSSVESDRAPLVQVVIGSVSAVVSALASSRARGQVWGMRILRRRWPRMMRAAVCSSR